MARIELRNYQIIVSDGAGNEFVMTDRKGIKAPKTQKLYDKLAERLDRIGGQRRSNRLWKKWNKAQLSKLAFEGNVSITVAVFEWKEQCRNGQPLWTEPYDA